MESNTQDKALRELEKAAYYYSLIDRANKADEHHVHALCIFINMALDRHFEALGKEVKHE